MTAASSQTAVVRTAAAGDGTLALCCEALDKNFGGVHAVRGLTFDVRAGEVFGIAGPNGAGKTTLFNLISGHLPQDQGRVVLRDTDVTRLSPDRRFRLGMARTFQIPEVFDTQTILENVVVGAYFGQPKQRLSFNFPAAVVESALEALRLVDMADRGDERAASLGAFDKKRLMIASALAARPAILLLDEPFGGLNHAEMGDLARTIEIVNREGVTIVVIEHVLKELFRLASRVLIMHHGEQIFLGAPDAALRDPRVIESYLGERTAAAGRGNA